MSGFAKLKNAITGSNLSYKGHIPDNWRQGRTAYGGITSGLMYAAVERAFSDLPQLRSAQINFIGPVSEAPQFTVRLLRQGRNVTSIQVETMCEDKIAANAVFIFGTGRESHISQICSAPDAPMPEECEMFTLPESRKFVPEFFHRFETKLIAGGRPFTGQKEAYIRAWSRHDDADSREGMASFLALGDVLPPAALPTAKKMGAISSVNWQMNILKPAITADGWWHVETRQSAASDGYSSQLMRFWNMDGDLVAEGMQSVAMFM